MPKIILVPLCFLCLMTLVIVTGAFADYYKYTDSQGVIGITNKLDSVPAKYRSSVKVIREASLSKSDPGASSQARRPDQAPEETASPTTAAPTTAAAAPATAGKFNELSARYVWFRPLVYVGIILALFVAIVRITSLLSSRLLAKLIYIAFSLGVFGFLYKAYAGHLVENTRKLKEDAAAVVKSSNARQESMRDGTAATSESIK